MFWTMASVDVLIAAVILFFFAAGLGDGTVSSFNMAIWLPMVGVPVAVLCAGMMLRSRGRVGLGTLVLAGLAVPGLAVGAFGLVVVALFAMNPGSHH